MKKFSVLTFVAGGILIASSAFAVSSPKFTITSLPGSTDTVSLYYKPIKDHTSNPGTKVQGSDTAPGQKYHTFEIDINTAEYNLDGVNSDGQLCGPETPDITKAGSMVCKAIKGQGCTCAI